MRTTNDDRPKYLDSVDDLVEETQSTIRILDYILCGTLITWVLVTIYLFIY